MKKYLFSFYLDLILHIKAAGLKSQCKKITNPVY